MKQFSAVICAVLALLVVLPTPARAQPAKDQLKAQFKAREMELRKLKQDGRIGETLEGYVSVVEPGPTPDERVAHLLDDENSDRRRLYEILAEEINKEHPDAKVKATQGTIASRNALRNIERAGPEERLLVAKDHWIRVKDFSRFQKLSKLKGEGRVGETAGGLVEIVKSEDQSDRTVESLVREENASRTAEYKALAEKDRVEPSLVAKRMAKRNFDNARVGDMLQDESGSWRKK